MFAQQPQNNQYQPYLLPTQQPDAFDQVTKLIDLVERLANKNRATEGGNIAPGTSQYSPLNAGMFQAQNPESIAIQELLLKNPELLQQYQALHQQKQQFVTPQKQDSLPEGSRVFTSQEQQQIKQAFETAVNCANEHYQQLQALWTVTQHIMDVFNNFAVYAQELEKIAELGYVSQGISNAFMNELQAARDVIDIQQAMLSTPQYLLVHGFGTIAESLEAHEDDAMNLISECYLSILRSFEEKKKTATGKYSPQYQEYLQSQINQQPQTRQPSRQQNQTQASDASIQLIRQFAQGLQQEGFASQLKRAHTQQLAGVR